MQVSEKIKAIPHRTCNKDAQSDFSQNFIKIVHLN